MSNEEMTERIPLSHGVTLEISYSEPRGTTIHFPDGQTWESETVHSHKSGTTLAQFLRMEEEERKSAQVVNAPFSRDADEVDSFDITVPLWVALRGKPTIAAYLRTQESLRKRDIANMMGVDRSTVLEYLRRVRKGEE